MLLMELRIDFEKVATKYLRLAMLSKKRSAMEGKRSLKTFPNAIVEDYLKIFYATPFFINIKKEHFRLR